jgi:hypothetical protein
MRIFVGAVLACAALVGTARGDTYCVSPATGCDHAVASIQSGLTQAASHAGDDAVRLGTASYNLDTDADAGANDLTYPTSGAQGKVTLQGAGPGQTTVTRSLAVASSEALIGGALNSTGQLDARDLKVQLPASQGAAIATLGTVFDDLALVIPDNASTGIVLTASGAALTSSTVTSTLTASTAATCVRTSPNSGTTSYTITDVTGTGCTVMLNGPSGTGRTDVERLRMQSPQGISVGSGVHAVFDNSLIRLNAGSTTAILVSVSGSADTTPTINQSTVLGPGSTGIGIQAFNNASTTNAPHVNLYDSIVRGFATSLRTVGDATHAASITGDHDSYASATVSQAAGTTLSVTQSLNDPDPLFTSASDFTLQPLSPLIDNDPTALDPLNEPGVDLAGNIRIVGGKRDLGAYELPALPTASTQAATAVSQTGATIAGAANTGGAAAGGSAILLYGTTAAYGASMPAHTLSRSIGDQAVSDAISGLAPGTAYHYALRVTNARGTTTGADRTFTTAAPPTPPATTTSTPAAPETPAVAAVTKLSLSPTTLRPMTKGPMVAVAARGAKLTITLTTAAKVTFSVVRRQTGVRVGKSCLARGHGRHGKTCTRTTTVAGTTAKSLAKGTSTLRFSARVGGHALKPGSYALRATPVRGKGRSTNFHVVR